MKTLFLKLCPNCGGEIDDVSLALGVPCRRCLQLPIEEILELKNSLDRYNFVKFIYERLRSLGTLKHYEKIYRLEEETRQFNEYYKKLFGNDMWAPQRSWLKRYLLGKSFSIVAPTGLGKTTFGIFLALHEAAKGKKVYIIAPTTVLLLQTYERLLHFREQLGFEVEIACYHARLSSKEKLEAREKIASGEFDILLTTSQYLSTSFNTLEGKKFDLIFVDDVDALLKASKNVDKVLQLLGFDKEIIQKAFNYLKLLIFSPEKENEIEQLRKEIEEYKSKHKERLGQLIVASATGRQRGLRSRLFKVLLDFEAGSSRGELRKIVDSYVLADNVETAVLELVRLLGSGGLVFVRRGLGAEKLEELAAKISSLGLKAAAIYSGKPRYHELLEKFRNGEIDVLVGVATFYGTLVRGLDMPERIRYAVFYGVPVIEIRTDLENITPSKLFVLANLLIGKLPKEIETKILSRISKLKKWMAPDVVKKIQQCLEEGKQLEGFLKKVWDEYCAVVNELKELLKSEDILAALQQDPYISCRKLSEHVLELLVPDIKTYIQASGRTSRLYAGGITLGLSVVVDSDPKLVQALGRLLSLRYEDARLVPFSELNLQELLKKIDEDRKRAKAVLEGKIDEVELPQLKVTLFVVESPNKARTIASFFGRPSRLRVGLANFYEVTTGNRILIITASGGHVYDLVTRRGIYGVEKHGEKFIPVYCSIKINKETGESYTDQEVEGEIVDKQEVVQALQEMALTVDEVIVGTDFDTEGEKIGWDLALSLSPYVHRIYRAIFTEVTRSAILKALEELRTHDERWVEAQLVRRIEDRWIGFSLSQKLWKVFGKHWLSAGRVQTPVLGWIIQRYKEHLASRRWFIGLLLENGTFLVLQNVYGKTKEEAENLLKQLENNELIIERVELEEKEVLPPRPYTTDLLLRDACRRLKLSAEEVMQLAQDLFELSLITYHRTDSCRVSSAGIEVAKEYILQRFGEQYFVPRKWGTGGAHEAIRPVRPLDAETLVRMLQEGVLQTVQPLTRRHIKLYDLIFRRFIASQMAPAKVVEARAVLRLPTGHEEVLQGIVEIRDPSFLQLYDPGLQQLPVPVQEGARLKIVKARTWLDSPVQLYTQADIIRLMREKEIGRPSTYARIVATILRRKYVIETKKKELVPTQLGMQVYEYLTSNYHSMVSEERTRELEKKMLAIEEGKLYYQQVIRETFEEILPLLKELGVVSESEGKQEYS
ncbi:MAG: reverse gyrase [bacterium]|nr:reverse gyrase [bacterium]